MFHSLLVAYVSATLHVLASQLNCICVTQFVSVADKLNIVLALLVDIAHVFIEIDHVGHAVSSIIVSV
jgi:hypothetical protein